MTVHGTNPAPPQDPLSPPRRHTSNAAEGEQGTRSTARQEIIEEHLLLTVDGKDLAPLQDPPRTSLF